eukprot:5635864-Lingulodinium_polyedra.AAC.2
MHSRRSCRAARRTEGGASPPHGLQHDLELGPQGPGGELEGDARTRARPAGARRRAGGPCCAAARPTARPRAQPAGAWRRAGGQSRPAARIVAAHGVLAAEGAALEELGPEGPYVLAEALDLRADPQHLLAPHGQDLL